VVRFLENFWSALVGLVTNPVVGSFVQALILFVAGLIVARLARTLVVRSLEGRMNAQHLLLLRRSVSYGILTLFLISALRELGFDFGVLLGAAGIISLAVGFASQTSVSNLISGLFLVFERAVEAGDVVKVAGFTGEVLSIDLLSTKLRTFDNLLVRIPNETMVKAEITNLSRFPIRRIDTVVGVAYKADLDLVQRVLFEIADSNPLSLEEPAPVLIAQGFGSSSIDYQFSVWGRSENFLALRNGIQQQIKEAFERHGIEIPFPHISVYAGSATEPFPLRQSLPEEGPSAVAPTPESASVEEDHTKDAGAGTA
jgi:small-conductance mechanosensitive channel